MPSLTDGQIKNALKRVAKAQKPETLVDGEGRGASGRGVVVGEVVDHFLDAHGVGRRHLPGAEKAPGTHSPLSKTQATQGKQPHHPQQAPQITMQPRMLWRPAKAPWP